MTITIKAGSGFINGYYYRNTTDLKKTLAVADGVLHRIDRIVMRWSLIDRAIYIAVKQGAPSNAPTAPSLKRDAEVYELALADIYIGAGITAVSQSSITDRRADINLCGFVTGVIDQFDFSTLCAQFEAFFSDYRAQIRADYSTYTAEMEGFEAAAEADFTTWFDGIKHVLDGDTAGNLYNEVNAVRDEVGEVRNLANSIQTGQIADGAVTGEKIASGSVSAEKLVNGAVSSAKLADGAVTAEKIANSSITAGKLAAHAVSADYTATIGTGWAGAAAPYSIEVTVNGILASDTPFIDLNPSATYATAEKQIEGWGYIYRAVTAADKITFYATEKPTVAIPIKIKAVRK